MTDKFTNALQRGENWLQDLIRDRESTRAERQWALPPGQRELSLQTANFPVPNESAGQESPVVSISRNLWDFCKNTLNHIGEHPIEFALSVGAAMAVKWAVVVGLGVVSGGAIAGLGLAIAAAMLTSVIMVVGRAALKGEELDGSHIINQALLSGVIAGVLGAFLGGHIAPPEHSAAHPSVEPVDPGHSHGHGQQHYHPGEVHTPTLAPYDGTQPVTDQYVWDVQKWDVMEARMQAAGEDYAQIRYSDIVEATQLLKADADWYVFLDENQRPYQVMHRDALQEMVDFTRQHSNALHLKSFSNLYIENSHSLGASVSTGVVGPYYRYDLQFTTSNLVDDKDMYEGSLTHELGHVVYHTQVAATNPLTEVGQEKFADQFALDHGSYGGRLERFVRYAIESGDIDYSKSHPALRDRMTEVITTAANDTTLSLADRKLFELRIAECQGMLNSCSVGKEIDLHKLWQQASHSMSHRDINLQTSQDSGWLSRLGERGLNNGRS